MNYLKRIRFIDTKFNGMPFLVGIWILLHSADGFVVYGQYGRLVTKTTFAVKEKVSWKEAAELCKIRVNGNGRLLSMTNPNILADTLLHHRHILQQNGWSESDHLWTGLVSEGNGTLKRSGVSSSCEGLSIIYDGYFPNQPLESAQCALLNMSGIDINDIWILRPCTEHHDYLCRSNRQSDSGISEITVFNTTALNSSLISDSERRQTLIDVTFEFCKEKIESKTQAFTAVYSTIDSTCKLYLSQTFRYPVKLEIVLDLSSAVFVKTQGHNVTIVESQNVPIGVNGSSFKSCFNESDEYTTAQIHESTRMVLFTSLSTEQTRDLNMTTLSTDSTETTNKDEDCENICERECVTYDNHISTDSFVINNFKLNRKLLSSYKRGQSSASDDRLSSFLIGLSGVAVLVMAVLMIIVPDVANVVKQVNQSREITSFRRNKKKIKRSA